MHIPAYVTGDKELWTPQLVRAALVEAFRVLRAMPGAGHKHLVSLEGEDLGPVHGMLEERQPAGPRIRAIDISHMEILLVGQGKGSALVNDRLMGYKAQRSVLIKWAIWVANGCRDQDGVPETDVEFSWRVQLNESTMKRYRDFAAGVVAQQANEYGIDVWFAEKPIRPRKKTAVFHAAGSV